MQRFLVLICMVFMVVPMAFAQQDGARSAEPASMSLEEKVGQLFMAAFRTENGKAVTALTPSIKKDLEKYHLGGVILFGENFINIEQTVKLTQDLQKAGGNIPLFIAVDQEGGRVNRFSFGTKLPGNMALGASGKVTNAYKAGSILGEELAALGINTNLAPVLDVNSNQDNPVIGIRSFGSQPETAAKLGAAYIKGLHASGVLAAIKHFPGHGDTTVDSHVGLPTVKYDKTRLKTVELKPFIENLKGTDMVMAAHIAFPALDATKAISEQDGKEVYLPASLSSKILTGLLRDELNYDGIIITDALEMKAISEHFGAEKAVIAALQAGADILLMPNDLDKAYRGVIDAVKTGVISEARINQSMQRILGLKKKLSVNALPSINSDRAQKIVGSPKHIAWEKRLARDAVTLLKNEGNVLPVPLNTNSKIAVFAPWQNILDSMKQSYFERAGGAKISAFTYENLDKPTIKQKQAIDEAEYIMLTTYSSTLASRTSDKSALAAYALALSEYAKSRSKKVIVMAAGTPYDIVYLPNCSAYLLVYGANAANIEAGMAAVFGDIKLRGTLPVKILYEGKTLFEAGSGLSSY